MIYFSINVEPSDIWVESIAADSIGEAEDKLTRNNPQVIFSAIEAKKIVLDILEELL